jgi:predicted helicase
MRKEEKLDWFKNTAFKDIPFELITPDKKNNWINLSDNDFEELIPLIDKKEKNTIFGFSSLGVSTNRDEWVYDFDKDNLESKMQYFIKEYNDLVAKNDTSWKETIKWSRDLKKKFEQRKELKFDKSKLVESNYRPFIKKKWYAEKILNDIFTQNHYDMFGDGLEKENKLITIHNHEQLFDFTIFSTEVLLDAGFSGRGTPFISLYRYNSSGEKLENITDWSLKLFQGHYQSKQISKEAIFHYVYGVLHNPVYRQKYEQNLKREFPRIPMYADFDFWVAQGKALMGLHLNYEAIEPYPLQRTEKALKSGSLNKAKLKADKEQGIITLDEMTSLLGVPSLAWEYKLGNRSALEWILDQYKEKKPKDPTIREKFNTYQFADYKEEVISLLQKVCAVSVKTIEIIQLMEAKE